MWDTVWMMNEFFPVRIIKQQTEKGRKGKTARAYIKNEHNKNYCNYPLKQILKGIFFLKNMENQLHTWNSVICHLFPEPC